MDLQGQQDFNAQWGDGIAEITWEEGQALIEASYPDRVEESNTTAYAVNEAIISKNEEEIAATDITTPMCSVDDADKINGAVQLKNEHPTEIDDSAADTPDEIATATSTADAAEVDTTSQVEERNSSYDIKGGSELRTAPVTLASPAEVKEDGPATLPADAIIKVEPEHLIDNTNDIADIEAAAAPSLSTGKERDEGERSQPIKAKMELPAADHRVSLSYILNDAGSASLSTAAQPGQTDEGVAAPLSSSTDDQKQLKSLIDNELKHPHAESAITGYDQEQAIDTNDINETITSKRKADSPPEDTRRIKRTLPSKAPLPPVVVERKAHKVSSRETDSLLYADKRKGWGWEGNMTSVSTGPRQTRLQKEEAKKESPNAARVAKERHTRKSN